LQRGCFHVLRAVLRNRFNLNPQNRPASDSSAADGVR
jgi:hypothetical protein